MTALRRALGVLVGLALASALLVSCAAGAAETPLPRTVTPPGFVGHDGREFVVDGRPTPLVGINVYNAASRGNCWFDMRSQLGPALDTIAAESRGSADVVRVWFFQSLATRDGLRDWTELDRVLATAREKGFRVIPVLTDQWGACEGTGSAGGGYKNLRWYQDGYRDRDPGGTVSYRSWAEEVVSRYRDDRTVALWSLVNEAEAGVRRSGPCPSGAEEALAGFTDDMGRVVKAADPNHLLGLGTIGSGQCGSAGAQYTQLHASPLIDFCEYHDYDVEALPGDAQNGLRAQLAACRGLAKPVLVGESGVRPDEVGGVEGRAATYRAKLAAQVPAGVAGLLMWGWSPTGYAVDDEYGIGPGDPSLPVLAEYGAARTR